jgi:hypothetical protein
MAEETKQTVELPQSEPVEQEFPSDVLIKPVEQGNLFPIATHNHNGVNSVQFPVSHLLGQPMYKLAEVTLSAAATFIESGKFEIKNFLKVLLFINGKSASTNINFQFNSDTGTNYVWRASSNAGGFTSNTSATLIGTFDAAALDTNKVQITMDVLNMIADQSKTVYGSAIDYETAVDPINVMNFMGLWKNESDQITSIKVLSDAAQTFGANSRLIIYGM